MTKIVIFAEKSSQAKAYGEALGVDSKSKYEIILKKSEILPHGATLVWGSGHLVEMAEPSEYDEKWKAWRIEDLPIFPQEFVLKAKPEHIERLKHIDKRFKEADLIVHGGDLDREGDNVFGSVLEYIGYDFNSKPIKRLWINSLEASEVRKGFKDLKDGSIIIPTFQEARCRQISDWLVGMNLSRLYSVLVQSADHIKTSGQVLGSNGQLSVGRVQAVATAMVYQRQLEVENFKPKPLYDIEAEFTLSDTKTKYKGKAEYPKEHRENKDRILDLLSHHHLEAGVHANGTIVRVEKNEKRSKPPILHCLSSLQIKMNRKYKIRPQDTLKHVQHLYDNKYLTYPRTNCKKITDAEFAYIKERVEDYKQTLVNLTGDPQLSFQTVNDQPQSRYVNTKEVEEHFAIVVTRRIPTKEDFEGWTPEQQNIYLEILRTVLGMFHGDYVYEETVITTQLNALMFKSKGKVERDKGFKAMWFDEMKSANTKGQKNDDDDENEQEDNQTLPFVSENEAVSGLVLLKEGQTTPPKLLTEGDLTYALTNAGSSKIIELESEDDREILKATEGIATEATRSEIISTIQKRGYAELKSNRLHITPKGRLLCTVLEGTLLTNPSMTAQWERFLNMIGKKEKEPQAFIDNIKKFILYQLQTAPTRIKETNKVQTAIKDAIVDESVGGCPFCTGKIIERSSFYGCSGFKDGCKFTIQKTILGKRITQKQVQTLLKDGYTNKIKGFKKKTPSANGKDTFDARLRINRQKQNVEFDFS